MPIQKQFRLNRNYQTSQDLLTGHRFIDLINKIASSQSLVFPSNATSINVNLNFKGQLLYGNLLQVLSDIQEIGDEEILENGSANFQANLNPIKWLNVNVNYIGGNVNISSNNLTQQEFEESIKSTEQFFPISREITQSTQSSGQVASNISDGNNSKQVQSKRQVNSKSVFVIMSFNDDYRDSYFVAIQPTLRKLGFEPIRVDEIQHNNTVTKEIIEAIEGAAFVVADLTGERPNVYYEVGYAHKADKEVVLVAKKGTAVHFDVAAINRIDYKDYTDLCDSLEKRVKAVAIRLGIQLNE